jgi:3-methyladenine DNA glycosylase AlkD
MLYLALQGKWLILLCPIAQANRDEHIWSVLETLCTYQRGVGSRASAERQTVNTPRVKQHVMPTSEEILTKLKAKARPDQLAGMARYGMKTENRLGVQIPELRKLAKETGKNHQLALELWQTGIAEARILAAMIAEPEKLTEKQMDNMVKDIDSWDIGDQTCMNLFEKTPLAWKKINEWSKRPEEFVKRTAYGLIACIAWHDKKATDQQFTAVFPVIAHGAQDQRKSVQKAVSWALRNIGKRNTNLNQQATSLAREIQATNTKPAKWVSSDVIRELTSEPVQKRLKKQRKKS